MQTTFFSIVTVCKNPGISLIETLQSLKMQTYGEFELIVVDGGSADGTVQFLQGSPLVKKYVSEPDKGIYDAMNKGITLASGKYIYFLNCGDSFHAANVLENVASECNRTDADFIYGNTCLIDSKNNTSSLKDHAGVDKFYLFHKPINHQAIFAKKTLFEKVGVFDLGYKVKADHEWIMRCFVSGCRFQYVPIVVSNYVLYGFAFQNRGKYRVREKKQIQGSYFNLFARILLPVLRKLGIEPKGTSRHLINKLI
jgi:glycosyltransferase involved in cell wall biosynthesis